jgi:methionyl-tRNA synthetase
VPDTSRDFSHIGVKGRLDGGRVMPAPSGLFPRYVEEDTSAQDTKA